MACAEGQGAPPPELELYWQCTRYHALPRAGGVLDQPAGLMRRVGTAGSIYETWGRFIYSDPTEFRERYPQQWRTVGYILELKSRG